MNSNYTEMVGLTEVKNPDYSFCMKGKIRTKENCPKCGGQFSETPPGLICLKCQITPKRFFIDFYHEGRVKIYSDKQGNIIDSFQRANRILEAIRYEVDNHKFDPKLYSKKDLREYQFDVRINEWIKEKENNKRLEKEYVKKLRMYKDRYYIPYFKKKDIREIRYSDSKNFVSQLPSELKPKTIKNICDGLRNFYNEMCNDEYITAAPKTPTIEVPETPTAWLEEDVQKLILEKIPDRHKPIMIFLMETGTRTGEARALKRKDLDLNNRTITIQRSYSKDVLKETTKTKRIRTIPMSEKVYRVLLAKIKDMLPEAFVFTTAYGKPYGYTRTYKIWKKACRDLGIKMGVHSGTRHSLASQAANNGVSLWKIQKVLGHTNSKTTERYSHARAISLSDVVERGRKENAERQSGDSLGT